MSRVQKPINKFCNMPKENPVAIQSSKVTKLKTDKVYPEKARSLKQWLFLKYDISYNTYRNKSSKRRAELRAEYEHDTGSKFVSPQEIAATRKEEG